MKPNPEDLESSARAIFDQRRAVFTFGPPPNSHVVRVTHGASAWTLRFSIYMPPDAIAAIVAPIADISKRPGVTADAVAMLLAYAQAADIAAGMEDGGAS